MVHIIRTVQDNRGVCFFPIGEAREKYIRARDNAIRFGADVSGLPKRISHRNMPLKYLLRRMNEESCNLKGASQ